MEYNAILESYYDSLALEEELDDNIYQIAIEAQTNDPGTNQINTGNPEVSNSKNGTGTGTRTSTTTNTNKAPENSPAATGKIMDMISKIIDNIKTAVRNTLLMLKNRLKKVMMTDQGFKEKLRNRERTVKPLNAVKITSYQYLDEFMTSFMSRCKATTEKLLGELVKCCDPKNPLPPKDPVLQKSQNDIVGAYLQTVTRKEDLTEVNTSLNYLQNMYRGQKKETTYKSTDLPNIIRLAEDHQEIHTQVTRYLQDCNKYVADIESRSKMLRAAGITDAQRRDFLANNNKALKIFNAYKTLLNYIYELRVEKAMNYRIIVQKFYQF